MANPIAEAAVVLRSDGSSLAAGFQRDIDQALAKVRVSPASQQKLSQQMFGVPFQRAAATGATSGLANTKVPIAAQRSVAQQLFGSAFRTEGGRALQGALVGLGGGQLAAQAAFFGPGGAALASTVGGLVAATASAANLEQALAILAATTQASEADIVRAGEASERLGADLRLPGVTATAAANAITELAKAGLTLEDAIAGAEGTLNLAIAAEVDTGTAARIAASGLNAFSLAGTDAGRVADLLAGASIAAQGDIGDMALALSQSAAVADQAGLSIEQLVGLITLLARQGILGSDAGTSIRTMLLRLVPTTKEASAEMANLGVSLDETRTIGQQLPEVITEYQRGLAKLTPIQRQASLQQIFGTDAIRSATVAFSAGAAGLKDATDAAAQQGSAARLAQARTEGLSGSLSDLTSATQTLGITIGQLVSGPAEVFVDKLALLVGGVDALADAANRLGGKLAIPEPEVPDAGEIQKIASAFERIEINPNLLDDITELFRPRRFMAGPPAIEDIRQMGEQLRIAQLNVNELAALFQSRSGLIADVLRDGVISPLEVIELRSSSAGRAFLAGFSGAGTALQPINRAVKELAESLGRLPTEEEVNIVLNADSFAEGLRQVVTQAFQAGTLVGDAALGAFGEALSPEKVAPKAQFLVDGLTSLTPAATAAGGEVGRAFLAGIDTEALGRQLEATGITPDQVREIIQRLDRLGPGATATSERLGNLISRGLAAGISEEEAGVIASARATLDAVIRDGDAQILESIRSARANLESLGDTLSQGFEEIIDAGPIGEELDRLNKALDDLEERTSRRELRFDVRDAKRDLEDAQKSLQQVGVLSPRDKKAQQEFLDPFREELRNAKTEVKKFDLSEAIEQQEKFRDAAVRTAEEGLQKLIDDFENGRISAGTFTRLLNNQLGPALDTIKRENLGLSFERGFLRDVKTLVAQVQKLAPFIGTPGTTPGSQAVSPAQTQSEVLARVAAAEEAVAQAIKDAREVDVTTNALLKKILAALTNPPKLAPRPR